MIPVKHIDPDDLPLYAMQLLPSEETDDLSLHLKHSSEARRVLSEIYGDLALFALTAEMHSPPALTRQRLMKHVAREKKVLPVEPAPVVEFTPRNAPIVLEPVSRSVASRVLPWVGWAIAAGLAVEAGVLAQQKQKLEHAVENQHVQLAQALSSAEISNEVMETLRDPSAQNVVLTPSEGHVPPQGRATYDSNKGSLIFIASNLEPLQAYKTYELWLLPADGRDPIPAGTFHPDIHGNASVLMPQLLKGTVAKGFGVTIEDGQGSQAPTTPIILKGFVA